MSSWPQAGDTAGELVVKLNRQCGSEPGPLTVSGSDGDADGGDAVAVSLDGALVSIWDWMRKQQRFNQMIAVVSAWNTASSLHARHKIGVLERQLVEGRSRIVHLESTVQTQQGSLISLQSTVEGLSDSVQQHREHAERLEQRLGQQEQTLADYSEALRVHRQWLDRQQHSIAHLERAHMRKDFIIDALSVLSCAAAVFAPPVRRLQRLLLGGWLPPRLRRSRWFALLHAVVSTALFVALLRRVRSLLRQFGFGSEARVYLQLLSEWWHASRAADSGERRDAIHRVFSAEVE